MNRAENRIKMEKLCTSVGLSDATLADFTEGPIVQRSNLGYMKQMLAASGDTYAARIIVKAEAVEKKQTLQVLY